MFVSVYFSEHKPRCVEGAVWVKLHMSEGGWAQKDKHPCPVLPLRWEENIGYLLQEKGPEPWINAYTGSTREQRILGYL